MWPLFPGSPKRHQPSPAPEPQQSHPVPGSIVQGQRLPHFPFFSPNISSKPPHHSLRWLISPSFVRGFSLTQNLRNKTLLVVTDCSDGTSTAPAILKWWKKNPNIGDSLGVSSLRAWAVTRRLLPQIIFNLADFQMGLCLGTDTLPQLEALMSFWRQLHTTDLALNEPVCSGGWGNSREATVGKARNARGYKRCRGLF